MLHGRIKVILRVDGLNNDFGAFQSAWGDQLNYTVKPNVFVDRIRGEL